MRQCLVKALLKKNSGTTGINRWPALPVAAFIRPYL
jgi:hypothetical protein